MEFLYLIDPKGKEHRKVDSTTVGFATIERLDFIAECLAVLVEEICGPQKVPHTQLSASQTSEEDSD